MRYAIIACRVFNRELSYLASQSENICTIYWLEQGLHNTPDELTRQLQAQIDRIEALQGDPAHKKKFDAILLCYGLCANGIAGISAKTLPLVVPRCDDCIALFLGSQRRYLELFQEKNGIYWYNPGWIEIGSIPTAEKYKRLYAVYAEQYGEDNASYLVESEKSSLEKYSDCILIQSPVYHRKEFETITQKSARYFGWQYTKLPGDLTYIKQLLDGDWPPESFLVCPPGKPITLSYDERKVK